MTEAGSHLSRYHRSPSVKKRAPRERNLERTLQGSNPLGGIDVWSFGRPARHISDVVGHSHTRPGTNIRFGGEALLRLWPVIGDAAASALSMYLLYSAKKLGVPRSRQPEESGTSDGPLTVRQKSRVLEELFAASHLL